ncbi:MAG: glycosyltransferase family 4 protein [Verrucomicrobiota bacterium]
MNKKSQQKKGESELQVDEDLIFFIDQTGQLGGAELCLYDIAVEFREKARVVLFQEGAFRDRLVEAGIGVTVFDSNLDQFRRSSGPLGMVGAMVALVNPIVGLLRLSKSSDLFYANTQKAAIAAFVAGKIGGRKTVWHLHDIITSPHFSRANRGILVALANASCSHVIANSEASLEAFREAGGTVPGTVVYNGIDRRRFAAGQETAISWRRKLGLREQTTVGIFGRLAEWKGQLEFVEALARCEGIQGIIVGGALFGDDEEYAKRVESRVADLGLEERVSFLGFRDDIPELMAACDVVVHASTDPEPFGRVIAEAMLSHRPVVATRGGGATELVGEENERGILVEGGNVSQLEEAIRQFIDHEELREKVVPAAFEFAAKNFSLEKIAVEIRAILNELKRENFKDSQREPEIAMQSMKPSE